MVHSRHPSTRQHGIIKGQQRLQIVIGQAAKKNILNHIPVREGVGDVVKQILQEGHGRGEVK